ncbi:hypothetical protein ES707_04625 [subsurface metagenome]
MPVWHRWEASIGYPRRLLTALENLLDDYGYTLPREEERKGLKWESRPLAGIAEFEGRIEARRDFHQWSVVQLIIALLLGLVALILLSLYGTESSREWYDTQFLTGLAMLIAAILVAVLSRRTLRRAVHIYIEGESYEAGAEQEKVTNRAKVERAGVASDVRLTIRAGVGSPEGDWELKKLTKNKKSREVVELEQDLQRIVQRVEELLPTLELPEIK